MNNICNFIKTNDPTESINILHFVYEAENNAMKNMPLPAHYSLSLVRKGSGILQTDHGSFPLTEGDLFFTFPAKSYSIKSEDANLEYMYMTFIGLRASSLMDRLEINFKNPVFHDFSFLFPEWDEAFLRVNEKNTDLVCEGLLFSTLSFLCHCDVEKNSQQKENCILKIKQYVDLHFSSPELSLEMISRMFGYSPKYLSSAFHKIARLSFSKYLCDVRMDYAKTLIRNGMISVKEISALCGYRDPLYFSKIFKEKYGVSPKKYMKEQEN